MMNEHFEMTSELRSWFGDRMHESGTGRVIIPSHLFNKYRKLAENEFITNDTIRSILIDECY